MAPLNIHTGRDNFLLLKRITAIAPERIRGAVCFSKDPLYLGLEALAQLGALHVRHITRLEKHVFLLKVQRLTLPAYSLLNGEYQLSGNLISRSTEAYAYKLCAEMDQTAGLALEGNCLFAAVDYSSAFKKEILQKHYQKVFSCLQGISGPV